MNSLKKQAELLNITDLLPCPYNREIDSAKVKKIKQAIVTTGMIKPLVYTEVLTDDGKQKMITDGHHRYVALKELGYKTVPAVMADERGIETAAKEKAQEVSKRKENPEADAETERIRENAKKPENQVPHDFKAAEWTHPNGHTRCKRCGDEESVSGRCNPEVTKTVAEVPVAGLGLVREDLGIRRKPKSG